MPALPAQRLSQTFAEECEDALPSILCGCGVEDFGARVVEEGMIGVVADGLDWQVILARGFFQTFNLLRRDPVVAFASDDRQSVDAFYHAALGAGARDNGAPGLRPNYHANYYSAFVLDPDGYNIEAVCHKPKA